MVKRMGYSYPGKHSLFPLDAIRIEQKIFIPMDSEKPWLLKYRKVLFLQAADSIKRYIDVKVPSIQVEILSQKAAQDFDEYYEQICTSARLSEAKKLPMLILTTDGKGIVVRKQDLRESTR